MSKKLDPEVLAFYVERAGDHCSQVRLASNIQARVPENIWAPMWLADNASGCDLERLHFLHRACDAGRLFWSRRRNLDVLWWNDPLTRPFMDALFAYARHSATLGYPEEAVKAARELLSFDPADRIGVQHLLTDVGVISGPEAERVEQMVI